MLRKNSKIQIFEGNTDKINFEFPFVTSVTINTSRQTFTDTAKVVFPNRLRRKDNLIDKIKIGDKIKIYLGYYPNLKLEFTGFISFTDKNSPLILKCEDDSFFLKRTSLPATTLRKTSLKKLIETFYKGETNILDAEIGDWKIASNSTLIDVFDELKSKLGVLSYFRNQILNVNTEFVNDSDNSKILIHFQKNVVQGSENIEHQTDTDIGVISHGVSVQKNGEKIEIFASYKDNLIDNEIEISKTQPIGVLNTLKVPDLTSDELEELVKMRLPKLFYSGVTGDLQTFGEPSVIHGDTAVVVNDRIPQINADYRINSIQKEFSTSVGYKQTLTLGLKTS